MAETPSTMLSLGTLLPSFRLTNVIDGKPVASTDLSGRRGVLVMFICNHCPFVKHIRSELLKVAHEALDLGLAAVAINSNSLESHPQDGPGPMKELAVAERWRFPYLFDETQEVAKTFQAACTPDLFLFDGQGRLAYRGQFDDSRPSNGKPVTGRDFRMAIAAAAAGQAPLADRKRASIGCNIKWAPGRAPDYFAARR